jgi:hypothetical protein
MEKLTPGPDRSATNPSGVFSVTAHESVVAHAQGAIERKRIEIKIREIAFMDLHLPCLD